MPHDSLTIRVSRSTHKLLRELASASKTTITAVVEMVALELHRKKFWADFNATYDAAKSNPGAWTDLLREDAAWDVTIADGLAVESKSHR